MVLSKPQQRAKLKKGINRINILVNSIPSLSLKEINKFLEVRNIMQKRHDQLAPKKKD